MSWLKNHPYPEELFTIRNSIVNSTTVDLQFSRLTSLCICRCWGPTERIGFEQHGQGYDGSQRAHVNSGHDPS